ncbi:hypothetical protein KUH03_42400 [Sphingobacterium sp. E70]|uniref:hypothetical protein n=1 Tax=Sphingobacterium sp. E70 TaxID=2853439 RepID=UPI00211CAA85|nr:hypothetical protein [Sphingobacterium sp. E70]ULT25361.1 hypothetical protein KUH03_42400 [Sphingobacterium sp. E70]
MLFAFANQGWMMFVFLIPYCLGGICGPALQSVITKNVPSNEQENSRGVNQFNECDIDYRSSNDDQSVLLFTHDNAPFKFSGAPFFSRIYSNDNQRHYRIFSL